MDFLIIGAGGQGLVVAEAAAAAHAAGGAWRATGFVDDRPELAGQTIHGLPVLGTMHDLGKLKHDGVLVAIGENETRRSLFILLESQGETMISVRHPASFVAPDATIGAGSMISANATVIAGARIGRGVLLNSNCTVDHQTVIGDFVHIGPGATVGGNVTIGDGVLIGLGASVMSGCRIGTGSIAGVGSVVVRDMPPRVVAMGVPARVVRSR